MCQRERHAPWSKQSLCVIIPQIFCAGMILWFKGKNRLLVLRNTWHGGFDRFLSIELLKNTHQMARNISIRPPPRFWSPGSAHYSKKRTQRRCTIIVYILSPVGIFRQRTQFSYRKRLFQKNISASKLQRDIPDKPEGWMKTLSSHPPATNRVNTLKYSIT